MDRVLESKMKLEAYEHVFRSTIQFALCCKPLASEGREAQASTSEDSGEDGSKIEKRKTLKLRPVFHVEDCILNHIDAAGKFQ